MVEAGRGRWRVGASGVEEAGARAEERAAVFACQRGETAAFARLVRLHQDIALRTAYLLTNDREGAEDVAQVAFLQAFRAIGRFDAERPFRPWLLGIVANEARMYRRGRSRRPAQPLNGSIATTAEPPLDQAVRADERARVRAALAELAEPLRTATVLHYFNDLSIEEVAAAQGCRPGTVKSRLHTARQRLRAVLAAAIGGDR
jgi:RNA polymerase sigma factor (sigma-70 family)